MRRRKKSEARKRTKPPGIREIAQTLGVSIGTVDRALHDRSGINQATRAKVLELAEALGYRPNLAARFLSSRKQFRVGVNLPREIASFFDPLGNAVHTALSYPRLGQGETEALEEALDDGIDGLVIAPGRPEGLAPLMRRAVARGIPVVCVNTDAPGIEHLATVSVDSATSGSLVGELMGRFLGGKGRIVVVTGQLSTVDHRQKLDGFRKENTLWRVQPPFEGMRLVLADVEAPALDKAVGELRDGGHDVTGVVTDVTDPGSVRALADAAYATYGAVHVLCNNAGVGPPSAKVWETTSNDWRWTFGVNVFGVANGIIEFVPRMLAGGEEGVVINTSSPDGPIAPMPQASVRSGSIATFADEVR